MNWLIEIYDENDTIKALIKEVKNQGFNCVFLYPDILRKIEDYKLFDDNSCSLFYGSVLTGLKIFNSNFRWSPKIYFNNNFDCSVYYPYYHKYLLNKNYIMFPISDIERHKEKIYNYFNSDRVFVRPNSCRKPFTGQVIEKENFEIEIKYIKEYSTVETSSLYALISASKTIKKEWRVVIGNKKIIAYSQYLEGSEENMSRTIDDGAFKLAEEISQNSWDPDSIYVVDICLSDNKYYLLEINAFSTSGLYNCDLEKVIREVAIIAANDYNRIYGEVLNG